jgi:uncharacterized protein YggE
MTTTLGALAAALLIALLAGVAAVGFTRPAAAQTSAGVPGMPQVTVQGQAQVAGRPDTATVQLGVETEATAAADALAQNTQQAQAIQQRLRDLGVAEEDIQTSAFSIYPVYGADGRQVTGYRVANIVSVTIRDLGAAGRLLDQVVQAGANSIQGISFSVSDPKALLGQAREQAMQDARARAESLARAGDRTLGAVLVISEGVAQPPVYPVMLRADAAQAADVPLQPGEQQFSVDVQVTYALQ